MQESNSRMYFDYAASTPVAPEVFRAMRPYFSERYGNPGSLHSFGQEAMAAVDRAREAVFSALGAKFREVIFTGSATEANNLALRGAAASGISRLIVSGIEHESVLETARTLGKEGIEVTELSVDKEGIVKLGPLAAALEGGPALVSVMYANNETGAVQPLAKISKMVRDAGSVMHTDAAQAMQFLDCSVDTLGVDLLTISAHKMYGPKGVGALYVKGAESAGRYSKSPKPHVLQPTISGGGQEFGLRSGTENVPLIAGLGAAVEYIEGDKEKHARRIAGLKKDLLAGIRKIYPRSRLNGPLDGLPHIANVWIPGLPAEEALIRLDLAGVAVSAGSACTARSSQPSHVLLAMGMTEKRAKESIRFSLGRPTSASDVSRLLKILRSL